MTSSVRRLAQAVAASPKSSAIPSGMGQTPKFYMATFIQPETVDGNLSRIQVGNSTIRYVPRLSSAWTTAPSPGTSLLVASLGGSFIILGIQVGNTGLATYP